MKSYYVFSVVVGAISKLDILWSLASIDSTMHIEQNLVVLRKHKTELNGGVTTCLTWHGSICGAHCFSSPWPPISPPPSTDSGKLWLLPLLFSCQACPQFNLWKDAFLSSWAGGSVAAKISPLLTLLLENYSSAKILHEFFHGFARCECFSSYVCTRLLAFHVFPRKTLTSCIVVDGPEAVGWTLSLSLCHCGELQEKKQTRQTSETQWPFICTSGDTQSGKCGMNKQDVIGQLYKVPF